MSDKQIEEMARDLVNIQHDFDDYCAKPCRECELGGVFDCESYYRATELYDKGYRKSTDVASEIFEEIERLFDLNALQGDIFTGKYFDPELQDDIAELKKKYTEVE